MKRFLIFAVGLCLLYSCVGSTQAEPVLLDFTAPYCGPCKDMTPIVDGLAAEGVQVRKIDISQSPDVAERYGVNRVPCFVVVDDGRETGRIWGRTTREKLVGLCRGADRTRQMKSSAHETRGGRNVYWKEYGPSRQSYSRQNLRTRYVEHRGKYRSIVRVSGNESSRVQCHGSGCAIRWGKRVVVVTAAHVLRGCRDASVRGKTRWHKCTVLGVDKKWDVAILEPEGASDFEPTDIGWQENTLKVGDTLESCGFGGNDRLMVNTGRITRFVWPTEDCLGPADMIMLDGMSRNGDSGGPLLNVDGKLVGVLWGSDNKTVHATQLGRLHLILKRCLGPFSAAKIHECSYSRIANERPIVPVVPASQQVQQTGFLQNRQGQGILPQICPQLCPQRQPTPAPQPNVVVQAEPVNNQEGFLV